MKSSSRLYLGRRFLILDEPTSVLTPDEADEVLGHVRALCSKRAISVMMITHKFREVTAYADDVSVLRRGKLVGQGSVRDLSHNDMAAMMIGTEKPLVPTARARVAGAEVLRIRGMTARDRSGLKEIAIDDLKVCAGEIVGIAGISGNGQMELMEVLTGQRAATAGMVEVKGQPYHATREESQALAVRSVPEEPLKNACAGRLSVVENIAFRSFDRSETGRSFWLRGSEIHKRGVELDHGLQGPHCLARSAYRLAVGGQCATGGAGAGADRQGRSSACFQSLLRP
ncbi:Vitamin B12 import ATP-binding protein BtuD [Frigidibacter albus]